MRFVYQIKNVNPDADVKVSCRDDNEMCVEILADNDIIISISPSPGQQTVDMALGLARASLFLLEAERERTPVVPPCKLTTEEMNNIWDTIADCVSDLQSRNSLAAGIFGALGCLQPKKPHPLDERIQALTEAVTNQ